MFKIIAALVLAAASLLTAQQPQANDIPPGIQPIYATNAKMTNGVAPGYWPTATAATGLTLKVSEGTSYFTSTVHQTAAQNLTMTNNTTNYVYLNMTTGAVQSSTSSFTTGQFPIAVVVTSGGNITSILDVRTIFNDLGTGSGGTGSQVIVNGGSFIPNPDFSNLPAATTNGINIAFQTDGTHISGQLVGDGNAAHFLNGQGVFTTTPAGGSFTAGTDLSGTSSNQTVIGILGHLLPSLTTGCVEWTGSAWSFAACSGGSTGVPYDSKTNQLFMGGSDGVVATVRTTTATAVTMNGTTVTVTAPLTLSDGSTIHAGQWIQFPGNVATYPMWSPSCMNFGIVQVASTGSGTFSFPQSQLAFPAQTSFSTCTGSQTGTGGIVQDATNFAPSQTCNSNYFNQGGTLTVSPVSSGAGIQGCYNYQWPGDRIQDEVTNYTVRFHSKISSLSGNINVWISSGDLALDGCASASSMITNMQNLISDIHADGGTVYLESLTGGPGYGSIFCPNEDQEYYTYQAWVRANKCTPGVVSTTCADVVSDAGSFFSSSPAALVQNSGPFSGHYTDNGAALAATLRNIVIQSHGGFTTSGVPGFGANLFTGLQSSSTGFAVDGFSIVDNGGYAIIPGLKSYFHIANNYDVYRANALGCWSNNGTAPIYAQNATGCIGADFFNNGFLQIQAGGASPTWGTLFDGGIHLQDILMGTTAPTVGTSCGKPDGDFRLTNDGIVTWCNPSTHQWALPTWESATTLYNTTGTLQTAPHIVNGSGALSSGTLVVTLSGSSVFASSSSYVCSVDDSTAVNGTQVTYTSGSSFTITGTGTDSVRYSCIGN